MPRTCRSACRRVLAGARTLEQLSVVHHLDFAVFLRPLRKLATIDMFDPLSSTFGEEPQPPWPTTPRTPNTPIPNLPRPSSRPSSRPQTPDNRNGLYGRQPQIYGQPEPGLISPTLTTGSNGTRYEKVEPYLKVRITGLDRNRRDILVKFDAQVCHAFPDLVTLLHAMPVADEPLELHGYDLPQCLAFVLRVLSVL